MSELSETNQSAPIPLKVVVAGGFGVGKTTFVGSVSEIEPLTTEAAMTEKSIGVDNASLVPSKRTTTVAMDFGRITIDTSLMLYLFGTPGQDRFGFMWDDLSVGALGAIVLMDTRRIDECFPAIDYFEQRNLPFVVAVNVFDPEHRHTPDEIREALDVRADLPVIECDARNRESVKHALLTLLDLVLSRAEAEQSVGVS